jgi:AraC-like DNA-binding protein
MESGCSFRAYDLQVAREPWPCVSTRSSELTWVLEGECWIEFGPARQQQRVLPGQGFIVLRGTPHTVHVSPGTRFVVMDLPVGVPDLLGVAFLPSGCIHPSLDRRLPSLWEQQGPLPVENLEVRVQDLLLSLPSGCVAPLEIAHSTRSMLEVKRFLEDHFAEPISIGQVAERFQLDRFYLLRNFKSNFGFTPLSYVRDLRLEHFIWSMMLRGDRTHTEAALDSGFGDYSTFCREVRARFGSPPSRLFSFR